MSFIAVASTIELALRSRTTEPKGNLMDKRYVYLNGFELQLNRTASQHAALVAPTRRPKWVPRRNPWAPIEPGRFAQGMLIVDPDEPNRVVL